MSNDKKHGGFRPETINNPGRPPIAKDKLKKAICITLAPDVYKTLEEIKQSQPGSAYSTIINDSLRDYWA